MMEEALCNTAVHGWQLSFLERDKHKHFEAGSKFQADNDHLKYTKESNINFDKDKMMKALNDFMHSQPPGYRDYCQVTDTPNKSFVFIRGVINLFRKVYECDQVCDELYDAIDLYFGIDTHRVRYSENISEDEIYLTDAGSYHNSIVWRDEVPVRMHIP